jgi:transposase
VIELLRFTTIEDVSKHLGMSWDTVKEIHVWALKKKFKKRKIKHLKHLGIDEIAVKKGHNYLTVVVDPDTGQVVWVAEGRKASSLEEFFKKLKQVHAPIEAIAIDMWPSYIKAVLKYYSYDVLVFDRYHIISECNKMIDELRRKEAQSVEKTEKNVFKGVRYLLLKGQEKIENDYKAQYRLNRLLEINQPLNTAYILKEELRELWSCTSLKEAEQYLNDWLKKAWASGVTFIKKFATMLASHRVGILNYFNHPITTGLLEGINNKIKVLKRKAYGYRDLEYFKMRIYFLHESRYALIG